MTIEEFIAELKKYEIKFECKEYEETKYLFRTKDHFCPICALIKAKGLKEKNMLNIDAIILGVKYLKLTPNDATLIFNAADAMHPIGTTLKIKKELEGMCYDD